MKFLSIIILISVISCTNEGDNSEGDGNSAGVEFEFSVNSSEFYPLAIPKFYIDQKEGDGYFSTSAPVRMYSHPDTGEYIGLITNIHGVNQYIDHERAETWPNGCGDEVYSQALSDDGNYLIEYTSKSTLYPDEVCIVYFEMMINGVLSFYVTIEYSDGIPKVTDYSR